MRRVFLLPLFVLLFIFITACKNADKKNNDNSNQSSVKTTADSLENEVMDGHNAAMAKYGKLQAMQNEAQRLLDSIARLPSKARQAATSLKAKLSELAEKLGSAKDAMDNWMEEYNMDSAVNDMEQRIKYLSEEKSKVSKIKESILNGLQEADSLFKIAH